MTHKEFTLTVQHTIYSFLDATTKAVQYKVGDKITVTEEEMIDLKAGETKFKTICAGHGMYATVKYNKYNFYNTAEVRIIETSYTEVKLGQRQNQLDNFIK